MTFKYAAAVCGAVMSVAFAFSATLAADSATPAAPAQAARIRKVDPLADKLLTQMCETLGSADAFSFHAEVLFDQVLPSAVKVQYAGAINFAVQRPDELAIDFQSDLGGKRLMVSGRQVDHLRSAAPGLRQPGGA
jgi:hypothetical protein